MKKLTLAIALIGGAFFTAKAQTGQQQTSTPSSINNGGRTTNTDKTPTVRPSGSQIQQPQTTTPSTPSPRYGQQQTTPAPAQNNSGRSSGKGSGQ